MVASPFALERSKLHGGSRAVKRPLELDDDADGPRPTVYYVDTMQSLKDGL